MTNNQHSPCTPPPKCAGGNVENRTVVDGQLVEPPPAPIHTSSRALAPALRHLPKLRLCTFLGQPVLEDSLQQLPPSLRALRVNRRAHTGPVNLEALTVLGVLQLPDLQPKDTLPPSVTRLLLAGRKQQSVILEPIHHLTRLDTLELQLCFAKRGQLAQLRDKVWGLASLSLDPIAVIFHLVCCPISVLSASGWHELPEFHSYKCIMLGLLLLHERRGGEQRVHPAKPSIHHD